MQTDKWFGRGGRWKRNSTYATFWMRTLASWRERAGNGQHRHSCIWSVTAAHEPPCNAAQIESGLCFQDPLVFTFGKFPPFFNFSLFLTIQDGEKCLASVLFPCRRPCLRLQTPDLYDREFCVHSHSKTATSAGLPCTLCSTSTQKSTVSQSVGCSLLWARDLF